MKISTTRTRIPVQRFWTGLIAGVVVGALGIQTMRSMNPAAAAGPDVMMLFSMLQNGQGDAALQQVAAAAAQIGGWTPAPGDQMVFDPYMPRSLRGSSLDYDELPDCASLQVSADEEACIAGFLALEQQVRFGPSLFGTPSGDGGVLVRPTFDDLLSTYIEEVGHSWQEYQYETRGAGSGVRIRSTSRAEADRWSTGREYQVKRYILSLDGLLLNLSDEQRNTLRGQICQGYANPMGHEVPAFGAPPGWPNSPGWPVSAPTADELAAFCTQ